MRVTEVQALVKYSTEIRGSWVAVELGSTASLTSSEETLESVSSELYARLSKQLKVLWGHNKAGGGETKTETQGQPSEASVKPGNNLAPTKEHWCVDHNQEWKPKTGKYGTFFSHKAPDGSWCNEAKK
jgi:hypothetical protein